MTDQRRQLEEAIASLEAQRKVLGDAVVDTAVGPLRRELAALDSDDRSTRRRQVTILFADVSGFTELSETLDPEVVQSRMNQVWSTLDGILESHGGHIDKHIGDAVMAIFGLPVPREDDPARAVRAALEMQKAIASDPAEPEGEETGQALALRIGLHTGLVLLGEVGSTSEFTAMGDTVNLASRLESSAPVGGVLVSDATWRQVRGLFDGEAEPPLRVKGKARPVQAVRVLSERGIGRRRERGVDHLDRPFVGREQELEHAVTALKSGLETGRPASLVLSGEPGVGKTRLAEELVDGLTGGASSKSALTPQSLSVITIRGEHSGRDAPYSAIQALVHAATHLPGTGRTKAALARLSTASDSADAEGARDALIQAVAGVLAAEGPAPDEPAASGATQLDSDKRDAGRPSSRKSTEVPPRGSAEVPARGSAEVPPRGSGVLLFLDDWQWLDRSSIEVLTEAMDRTRDAALAVLVTSRPDGVASAEDDLPNPTTLPLEPLAPDSARDLVAALLPELAAPAVAALAERSAGNPFFLEEIVHSLIARGRLSPSAAGWGTSGPVDVDEEIPASLTGVIQARLATLSSEARGILEVAAVFGDPFWDRAVADALAVSTGAAGSGATSSGASSPGAADSGATSPGAASPSHAQGLKGLDEILAEGIAMRRAESQLSDAAEFEFRHALFREVTYEHVLLDDRRRIHAAAGNWLAAHADPPAGELAGRVADHLQAGKLSSDAAHWHRLAGDYADGIYANREALDRYRRAEALLEDDLDELVAVLSGIERVLDRLGDREEQRRVVEALNTHARNTAEQGAAELAASRLNWSQGDLDAAHAAAERALQLARDADEHGLTADARRQLGRIARDRRDFDGAKEHFAAAAETYRTSGEAVDEGNVLLQLGALASESGDFDGAIEHLQAGLDLVGDDPFAEAWGKDNLAVAHACLGDLDQALSFAHEATQAAERCGSATRIVACAINLAGLLVQLGRNAEAERRLRGASDLAEQIRDDIGRSLAEANLSIVLCRTDRAGEAVERLTAELERGAAPDVPATEVAARIALADALNAAGRYAEAREQAESAAALADDIGWPAMGLTAARALAMAALGNGDLDTALEQSAVAVAGLEAGESAEGQELRIWVARAAVLDAAGDPEASQAALETARDLLKAVLDGIEDPALRRSVIDDVPEHRELGLPPQRVQ